jgi:NADH-quinone oxidoreductase subunit C
MHNQIAEYLNKSVPGSNATVNIATVGDSSITVEANSILEVCKNLKESNEFHFNVLQVITAADYSDRMELSYVLTSYTKNLELILKLKLPRTNPKVNSVVSVWNAANFLERECFDMMGIDFSGHPDLRRILCPDDWEGFPLRKDYVSAKVYNGMVIDPPAKVNTEDHLFGKKLKEEIGNPKLVSASWKSDDAEETKDAE